VRNSYKILILIGVLIAIEGQATQPAGQATQPAGQATQPVVKAPSAQLKQVFDKEICKKVYYQYLLYLPKNDAAGEKRWPLLLFLHGSGERGKNLERIKVHGPPKLIEQGVEFPFIIVSPQCSRGQWWDEDKLDALLDEVIAKYAVDEDRVYVTGLSMGGFGTWALACRYPERFAAIMPISGGGITYRAREKLKDIPVLAFHGAKDPVVPVSESKRMVEAVKQVGGKATLIVYPEAEHDAWTRTYRNSKVYSWLLGHRRQQAGAAAKR